jgi:uncharacterized RDD family membrane protein YckC
VSQSDLYAPPSSSVQGPTPAELAAKASGDFPLASIGQRIGACLLEFLVLSPLIGLQMYLSTVSRAADIAALVIYQLFFLCFYIGMVRVYGGTPGKLIVGLRVVLTDRTPATWKASILRYAVYGGLGMLGAAGQIVAKLRLPDDYLSLDYLARATLLQAELPGWATAVSVLIFLFFLGSFISMVATRERRTLYDYLAGTIVVRTR